MNANRGSAHAELGSLPDQARLLLLRSCLCPGQEAVDAWRAWQARVAFDDLDVASMRLIPMLYHNLRTLGVDDPDLGRYQGLSRRSWYMNQLLFRGAADVLAKFQKAGIRTLVMKGVPLAHVYYPEKGLRPMSDIDVLVPHDQAERAIALLDSAGWKPDEPTLRTLRWQPVYFPRGWNFSNAAGEKLDLHWRALATSLDPNADQPFWDGAEPFVLGGVETLTLNATDHLIQACVHGLPANNVAPMRWVVDAMMLLRHGAVDWDRLLENVRKHRVSVMMGHAFDYLRSNFNAPVPDSFRHNLAQSAPEPWERAEFSVIIRTGHIARRVHGFQSNFRRMRCTTPFLAECSPLVAYLTYLRLRWGLGRVREIPAYVSRWIGLKVTDRLQRRKLRARVAAARPTYRA